jgi:hypothetical protein
MGGALVSGGSIGTISQSVLSNDIAQGGAGGGGGGTGGPGGNGGNGGNGAVGGMGGTGSHGGAGGIGAQAQGGGMISTGTPGNISQTAFVGDLAQSGVGGAGTAGGTGGNGGTGGTGSTGGTGGTGGAGGAGGVTGLAEGGALYNGSGNFSIAGTLFQSDMAISAQGGAGGSGGNGGAGGTPFGFPGSGGAGGAGGATGLAGGGGVFNAAGNLTIAGSNFIGDAVDSGTGGTGGKGGTPVGPGGAGGNAGTAEGGALALTGGNLVVATTNFGGTAPGASNKVLGGAGGVGGDGGGGGNGGFGGTGADAYGGAISGSDNAGNLTLNGTVSAFITIVGNAISSGAGGKGGNGATGGAGGNAGFTAGGGLAYRGPTGGTNNITINFTAVENNTSTGGAGAVGGIGSPGGNGGAGGSVLGAGVAALNYNLTTNFAVANNNIGNTGAGGAGGFSGADGASGGNAGNGAGGGIGFRNTSGGTLTVSLVNSQASNNQLTGGVGGAGANAGPGGALNHVKGGIGGNGGAAQGGGVSIEADAASVDTATVTGTTMDGSVLIGGNGAQGGQGENGIGGNGGTTAGGGLYANSLNTGTPSTLAVTGDTMAGARLTGGGGGIAGSGTTSNGGNGGMGGTGGSAQGGGLFGGANTTVTVTNSTFGALSSDPTKPDQFRNVLAVGNGGRGGNGGTAGNTLLFSNGGNGGDAGKAQGGGIYVTFGTATILNITIVDNQAFVSLAAGAGGAPGDAAGNGSGTQGSPGANGVAAGGGYFSLNATNNVGNTIIDLNAAASSITGTLVSTSPDVAGTFTSKGHNLLGTTAGATWMAATGDMTGVTSTQLNLGPLMDNGGPTPTVALVNGSTAIDAGDKSLLPASVTTDQRGAGYPRVVNNQVDVGAFELQGPTITSLNPNSLAETSGPNVLTINGTGLGGNTTVNFGGTVLTPASASGSQLTVVIPPALLTGDNNINVFVTNSDGSGLPGHSLTSNTVVLIVFEPANFLASLTNRTNNEGDVLTPAGVTTDPDASGFSATGLPPGLSINSATGVITGTIDPRGAGTYMVTVNGADDNTTGNNTFTWTVNDTTAPVVTNPGPQTYHVGTPVNLLVSSLDADTFTASNLPPGLTIDNTGRITGTPTSQASGTYSSTVTAFDGTVPTAVTFTWTQSLAIVPFGSANQVWISQVFRDLLHREIDQAALNFYTPQLENGAHRIDVMPEVTSSKEYRTIYINQQYMQILGRAADAGGLSFYLGLLAQGDTLVDVRARIFASDEFYFKQTKPSPFSFLNALYQIEFGTGIDASGVQKWGTLLAQTGSRYKTALAILTTPNAYMVEVNNDFRTWLGHNADANGLNYYVSNLLAGKREEFVIDSIFASPEYSNKLIGQYDSSKDKEWLNQVFMDLLNSTPDTNALNFYTTEIRQGVTRQDMVSQQIATSPAYRTNYLTTLYKHALSRPPSPDEINTYLNSFSQGATQEQIQSLVYGSAEYFFGRGKGNNLDFLKALYQDVLGVALDNNGLVTWGTQLANGVSRQAVAQSILTSVSGSQVLVSSYYRQYLRREPDSGASFWVNMLQSGTRDEVVLGKLIGSPEYYKKFAP